MKRKYRIKEYIRADGSSCFEIQERFFWFWTAVELWSNYFESKEEAEKEMNDFRSKVIVKTKIHHETKIQN